MFERFRLPCRLSVSTSLLSSQQCVETFTSCCGRSADSDAAASSADAEAGVDDGAVMVTMSSANVAPVGPSTTGAETLSVF